MNKFQENSITKFDNKTGFIMCDWLIRYRIIKMFLCAIQKVYVSRFSIIPVIFNYYIFNDNASIYQTDVENCEIVRTNYFLFSSNVQVI